MRQAERLLHLQEFFAKQEFVNFEELCRLFNASKSSIRRDLMELEKNGVIRRVHGGAISLQTRDEALDFSHLSESSHVEKTRIGSLAASLVDEHQTIILGGGSTAVEVAKQIGDKLIQIVTNSIPVAQVFWESKQVEVTLTGGYLYPRLGVQIGPLCEKMLRSVSADLVIMGIRGISPEGISDSNSLNVESIRAMIGAARKVVVVADHSKFGQNAMLHVAPLSEIDVIVTDIEPAPEMQKALQANGVECMVAQAGLKPADLQKRTRAAL
jgi:DeoR/GlpR family transcriptional regulator of sugar metabolism